MMLIKIVYNDNEVGYLSERYIDFVREMPCGECWRVHSLDDTWVLYKDKNEPFKIWLGQQIGGDAWQRETDRWENCPVVIRADLTETELEQMAEIVSEGMEQ